MYQGYQFDPLKGNLQSRTDKTRSITESFLYDNLNRLTNYGSNSVLYDIKGNILTKSDAGQMAYNHTSKPYAVTDVITSVVPSRNQNITYNSQMRPATITENGYVAAFTYDVSGERVKTHITNNGSLFLTRYYIGGVYEFDKTASTTKEKLYLGGDYYSAPVVVVKTGTGSWTFFNILRDHLGSVIKVTGMDGTLVAEYSYDAWGRMRNPANQEVYAVGSEPELFLGRGYTGHEHLQMFGLINMNARLYDPVLGRFLSPDPYVQDSGLSQNYNRYAYCLNNPLLYVDIDGNTWFTKLGKWLGNTGQTLVMIGVTIGVSAAVIASMGTLAPLAAPLLVAVIAGTASGAVGGILGAAFNGSNLLNGLVSGAASGAIAGLVGGAVGQWAVKSKLLKDIGINGINSPVLKSALAGGLVGSGSGGIGGFAAGYVMSGFDFKEGLKAGKNGLIFGAAIGAATGAYTGYKQAMRSHIDPWNGKLTEAAKTRTNDITIQFGKTENQTYHAFRHTDALGLDRSLVQSAIQNHFQTVSSQVVAGQPFNQIIEIGGYKIQYTAFKLPDGTFNIGRIHGVK